jgi:hypothetical protein
LTPSKKKRATNVIIQTFHRSIAAAPMDASALNCAIYALRSSIAAVETSINTLDSSSSWWEQFALVSALLVGLGVVMEIWSVVREYRETRNLWRRGIVRPPDRPVVSHLWFDIAATLLVVVGVLGEACSTGVLANKNGELRSQTSVLRAKSDQLLSLVTQVAGMADERAANAELESQKLRFRAAKDELELARLKGPVQNVKVVDGVARPDPTKALRLRVMMRANTVIVFPKLSRGESLDWTLFITQDNVGQHQFGTVPKFMPGGDPASPFGNKLQTLYPSGTCTMQLTSDENGTTDKDLGGANCPNPPSNPSPPPNHNLEPQHK